MKQKVRVPVTVLLLLTILVLSIIRMVSVFKYHIDYLGMFRDFSRYIQNSSPSDLCELVCGIATIGLYCLLAPALLFKSRGVFAGIIIILLSCTYIGMFVLSLILGEFLVNPLVSFLFYLAVGIMLLLMGRRKDEYDNDKFMRTTATLALIPIFLYFIYCFTGRSLWFILFYLQEYRSADVFSSFIPAIHLIFESIMFMTLFSWLKDPYAVFVTSNVKEPAPEVQKVELNTPRAPAVEEPEETAPITVEPVEEPTTTPEQLPPQEDDTYTPFKIDLLPYDPSILDNPPVEEPAPVIPEPPVPAPAPVIPEPPVPAPAPVETPAEDPVFAELRQFKELLDAGIITPQDYEQKKRRLLGL